MDKIYFGPYIILRSFVGEQYVSDQKTSLGPDINIKDALSVLNDKFKEFILSKVNPFALFENYSQFLIPIDVREAPRNFYITNSKYLSIDSNFDIKKEMEWFFETYAEELENFKYAYGKSYKITWGLICT